jgi:hypothetical protein
MYRKLFFLPLFLVVISVAANAQFKKGTRMVGSNIAMVVFNSGTSDITVAQIGSTTSKITNYNINISPFMGWFINNKTAVGITLNANPQGNKATYEENGSTYQKDQTNSFNIGLGGFVRNYFKNTGNLLPFGEIALNAGVSNLKTEGFFYGGSGISAYKTSYTGNSSGGFFFNATAELGFTKMINSLTGLDLYIGYNFSYNKGSFKKTTLRDNGNNGSIDERLENETTTKFTGNGVLLGVGFQIFLDAKK